MDLSPFVPLSVSGPVNSPINISFYQNAQIESFVWDDANGNGIQDTGEKGVPNVEVSFYVMPLTTVHYTDQNGFFKLDNIRPGQFSILVKFPNGYTMTKSNQGTNDDVDSDFYDQQNDVPSSGFLFTSISSGQVNLSLDFGLVKLTKIGNYVWEHSNLNGIQDIGEKPIKNVYVSLIRIDGIGKPISRITNTDSSGIYIFYNIFFVSNQAPTPAKLNIQSVFVSSVLKTVQGFNAIQKPATQARSKLLMILRRFFE